MALQNCHTLVALATKPRPQDLHNSVHYCQYNIDRGNTPGAHPLVLETEAKVVRGECCARAAYKLKISGFTPDLICAHPGWGESLFLPDVWPDTPILAYQEFFYHTDGLDVGFDPEFQSNRNWNERAKVRMKNAYLSLALESATWNVTPTHFQRNSFPFQYRQSMSVIHDGVDVPVLTDSHPITLPDGTVITPEDKVVTFVNRTLEPYRGCHTFIRSIPLLQKLIPGVRMVVIGATNGVSYGSKCSDGEWVDVFLREIEGQYDPSLVHFTGTLSHPDFRKLLSLSSCHVYLTYPFVLSWSLLEAMSFSLPIVASDTDPVQEFISDGLNGRLVDFFSPDKLASAIAEILNSPLLAKELGDAARQAIISKYSLDVCLPRQLQLLNLVASRVMPSRLA